MYRINEEKLKEIIDKVLKEVLNEASEEKTISDADVERIFHFSQIPDKELERQYWDLSAMVSMSGFGGPFMGSDGKILKEDATYTMSIQETAEVMKQKFNLDDWQVGSQKGANGIELMFLIPNFGDNIQLVNEGMEACGWSYSLYRKLKRGNMDWIILSYDPMFQENIASEAREYEYLYHWTPEYRYSSIRKEGLYPKSENSDFKYPNRLHLLKGNLTKVQKNHIGKQLCEKNKNYNNNGRYILLRIDTKQIPETCEIYYDPRYQGGYYTKEPIPPTAIKPDFGYDFLKNYEFPVFK